MRALIGLIHPTSGTILIDQKELGKDMAFPKSIGFLLENPTFLDIYSGPYNLRSVSYTHLDVYKRQADRRCIPQVKTYF